MVHTITLISVIGIAVTTAALVILIAAFNGIESMVEKLYSAFDSDITIQASAGKTFDQQTFPWKKLEEHPAVKIYSRAIEEIVVIKHEQKWENARLMGIEPAFLKMAKVDEHMVDGFPTLEENGQPMGLIGASLLDRLNGFIPQHGYETVIVYFPKRDAKMGTLSNPFRTQLYSIAGRLNYNREVNDQALLLPLASAADLLGYENDITSVLVEVPATIHVEDAKAQLQQLLGSNFIVKTHLEKNALIYQTSKTERLIVIAILIFVFILAAFNLVASLTMLYIEKKSDIRTLESIGASDAFVFRIFFFEGLLIAARGVVIGLVVGYAVCAVQLVGEVLTMPNSAGEAFPIRLSWQDGLLVLGLVSGLSFVASYVPVKYLMRRK